MYMLLTCCTCYLCCACYLHAVHAAFMLYRLYILYMLLTCYTYCTCYLHVNCTIRDAPCDKILLSSYGNIKCVFMYLIHSLLVDVVSSLKDASDLDAFLMLRSGVTLAMKRNQLYTETLDDGKKEERQGM